MIEKSVYEKTACFHCGENCASHPVLEDEKRFCCEGCKMVYQILNQSGLCNYYDISERPGSSRKIPVRKDKFAFLDDEKISRIVISFSNEYQTHITFYLPQIHCTSCLWLLENLHRLNENIVSCKVNFTRKEADIIFNHHEISLRKVAELLTSIGYEPYISLSDMQEAKPKIDRSKISKLGVAGFCFANIMMLSFPEYLGIDSKEQSLQHFFRFLSFGLSLPVFFYSATEFYNSAWKSLQHRFLNIDAPIVLAIWVTFARSVYEVITATGNGYFDSLSGIVFFMLIGRILQDKTYEQLSFDRDYTAYFPIAVTRLKNNKEETASLRDIKLNDTLLIHNEELIPADGILTRGSALIDYSFVTGESIPVHKEMGEIVYAGGKLTGANIELLVIKEVAQSYLTKLWNREEVKQVEKNDRASFVHLLARYFTWIVFAIAAGAAAYWAFHDVSKIWPSITAVLIIACPCALLLSNTFTNGNILRILSRNKFYLRSAQTIEEIGKADHISFDKTGTLTTGNYLEINYEGNMLTMPEKELIAVLASQSTHPLSRSLTNLLNITSLKKIKGFREEPGKGIEGIVDDVLVAIGSKEFIGAGNNTPNEETAVYVALEGTVKGKYVFRNQYRNKVAHLIGNLKQRYTLSVLSGDNAGEKHYLQELLGEDANIQFYLKPADKLEAIKQMQHQGKRVIMIGDGLNDAGALKQANTGIAVSDNGNNFTPASDAIIDAEKLPLLHRFTRLCRINRQIVLASFVISILYNITGIFFAVQGMLSPLIAAILMPASSLTILLVTFGASNLAARRLKLL